MVVGDVRHASNEDPLRTCWFETELRYSDQSEDAAIRTGLDGWRTIRRTTVPFASLPVAGRTFSRMSLKFPNRRRPSDIPSSAGRAGSAMSTTTAGA